MLNHNSMRLTHSTHTLLWWKLLQISVVFEDQAAPAPKLYPFRRRTYKIFETNRIISVVVWSRYKKHRFLGTVCSRNEISLEILRRKWTMLQYSLNIQHRSTRSAYIRAHFFLTWPYHLLNASATKLSVFSVFFVVHHG